MLSLHLVGPKKSRKIPTRFPHTKSKNKFTDELLQAGREMTIPEELDL